MVFPLVIHLGILVSCRHLFISIKTRICVCHQDLGLSNWLFFECCFAWIDVYFLLGALFEYLQLFSMFFIHSGFCYDLSVPIFCHKIFLSPSHPVAGMSSPIFPLIAGRIFNRWFGMSCFVCIVWSRLGIFLVFLLLPVPSDLSLQVVPFFLMVLLFSLNPSIFLCYPVSVFLFVVINIISVFAI